MAFLGDALAKTVSGRYPDYPADDDNALPDETGALDALAFARVHLSNPQTTADGEKELTALGAGSSEWSKVRPRRPASTPTSSCSYW